MRAFLKFNRGILRMPLQWRLWMMLLMTANVVVPLFFLGRLEAQVVLAATLSSLVLFTLLTARGGFTRLLGLGHLPWVRGSGPSLMESQTSPRWGSRSEGTGNPMPGFRIASRKEPA